MSHNRPELSIVSTLYNSESSIEEFVRSYDAAANSLVGESYEIILVNDGSPDRSFEIVSDLSREFPRLTLIDLSRNFGQHKALLTGMREAHGEYIYICDSDMEEPPAWLEKFWALMSKNSDCFDVVGGVQEQRKRGLFDVLTGGLSWKLFSFLSSTKILPNLVTARLMTRAYKDAVTSYPEKEIFLATLCSDVGFEQTYVTLEKHHDTETSYTFMKRLRLLIDGVTAFSVKPLYIAVLFSLAFAFIGGVLLLVTLYQYITLQTLPGWASLMTVLSLVFSAIFFVLSIQGLYIGRVFTEVRNRPQTIIRKTVRLGEVQ